jgi:hypothetical protein
VQWLDFAEDAILALLGMVQIPSQLKIHPKRCGISEKLAEPQSRGRRYPPSVIYNFIDPLIWNLN